MTEPLLSARPAAAVSSGLTARTDRESTPPSVDLPARSTDHPAGVGSAGGPSDNDMDQAGDGVEILPDTIDPQAVDSSTRPRDLRRVAIDPNNWFPLAWSRELKPGRTLGVHFAGDPIVLYRTAAGVAHALEDRCAHRQVPLHAGVVDGDQLRCGYHGWTYDCSGKCVDIPYLGTERKTNRVRAYPVRESNGLIFVHCGEPAAADGAGGLADHGTADRPTADVAGPASAQAPAGFPAQSPGHAPDFAPMEAALACAADPAYKTRRFGETVKCHYSFMHENLMDMNHQFLHRRQMGQMRARVVARRRGDDWVEVDYTFSRTGGKQPVGEALVFGERRKTTPDGKPVADADKPKDVMTIRTQYPYQTLRIHTGDGTKVMDLWIHYVPVDAEQRTNRTFGLLSIRRPKVGVLLDVAWPLLVWFTERIFREDRWIVEREQEAFDRQGGDENNEYFPVIVALRDLLRARGLPTPIGQDRQARPPQNGRKPGATVIPIAAAAPTAPVSPPPAAPVPATPAATSASAPVRA